ncbi:hypothetical protein [Lactococcus lactis]
MITNFDLYRWKKAGMTNLGVNKLLKFFHRYDKKISLRQMLNSCLSDWGY